MLKKDFMRLLHIESVFNESYSRRFERDRKCSRIFESLTDEKLEFLAEAYLYHKECASKAKILYPINDRRIEATIYETFGAFVSDNISLIFDACGDWAAKDYLHKLYPKDKRYFQDY